MQDNSFQNQKDASNPLYSVWVSASAGTGKTTVLVSRLLRLFLQGVDPTKILCLTYTKSGAIEMQDRIFKRARNWAIMNDEDLEKEIKSLYVCDIDDFDLNDDDFHKIKLSARKLFSKLIDNPIPLKIYTIHAFCESILKRFPIEANVSPHFKIISDIDSNRLLNNAYSNLIMKIKNHKDEQSIHILNQFNILIKNMSQSSFKKLIEDEVIGHRNKFLNLLDEFKSIDNVKKSLKNTIFTDVPFEIIDDFIDYDDLFLKNQLGKIPYNLLTKYLEIIKNYNTTTLNKKIEILEKFIHLNDDEKVQNFNLYKSIFLTQKNQIIKSNSSNFVNVKFKNEHPDLTKELYDEANRIADVANTLLKINVYKLSVAVIDIAFAFIDIYRDLKVKESAMDFDDLIEIVQRLFKKPNISEWILFKMDGGIYHVLIDEAQDTSPIQWDIVDILTENFFIDAKSEKNIKTFFSVGDRKQSIYGFQGADISLFEKYKNIFKNRIENGKFIFKDLPLNRSFRSCKNILNIVDDVLNNSNIVKGVLEQNEKIEHIPNRNDFDGYVELIPLVKYIKDDSNDYIKPPVEVVNVSNSKMDLADIIAKKIAFILKNDFIVDGKNPITNKPIRRHIEPKDIMILVQRRENAKFIIQKLNQLNIPNSGYDKMVISDNIVIEDFISLIKFVLSPYDDLSLAEVLKSPFYNLDDDDLFQLSYDRNGSLFNQLNAFQKYQHIYNELLEFIQLSRWQTPFLFFDYVLKVKDKRKNFIARFGDVINDFINEFMQKCLSYDAEKIGKSLFDFYEWFSSSNIEVKRDMEQVQNIVRIMTSHGAKGLEAPVVFLFDANINENNLKDSILWNEKGLPIFKIPNFKDFDDAFASLYNDKKDLQSNEFYRLLYVAMTRARDKLYISGWEDGNGEHKKSWYNSIYEVIKDKACKKIDPILQQKGEEFVNPEILFIGEVNPCDDYELNDKIENNNLSIDIPKYFYQNVENNNIYLREEEKPISPLMTDIDDNEKSMIKGKIIHKILENIKDYNNIDIDEKITQFLIKSNVENYDKILFQIKNILNNNDLKFLFDENSFAEVELVSEGKTYRIDKLIIKDNCVYIIDYKTDTIVPDRKNIPSKYINQLKEYKKIISNIYPDYEIKTYILWFENANLMEVIL